ncbi:hypothetical protein [Corynebacterium lowii]|uniref:Uncharacterized protein n=1 Tax=Corynebacterium lowii TaxID=1544413 RepID=A0A0Q0U3C9_9CORY|nr:hypothetical protein [Corynebacterium lowii]KQB86384.1 hypothetical protein Clow_01304 [Corynebacterium lowii]MDP9850869.1 hypothetical protein [Corynebacterium lowii]
MIGTLLSSALAGLLSLSPFLSPADHIPGIDGGYIGSEGSNSVSADENAPQNGDQEDVDPGFFIHGGELAVKRAIFEEEQTAGHKLVSVEFIGNDSAILQQAESFNHDTDSEALDRILDVLKINGYTHVSMLAVPPVIEGE